MKRYTLTTTLCALALAGTLQGQVTILSEDFDPALSPGANIQVGYTFGDTTAGATSIATGAGVGGTDAWQIVNTADSGANGFSGVGAQYQNGGISGNTSMNLSDYTLSFDARANAGNIQIRIETWEEAGFGGAMTGLLSTAPPVGFGNDVPLNPDYTHYSLNLGDTDIWQNNTGIDITGGTIQITMQFNGGGPTPYSNTLDVDNLTLAMIPEPSTYALAGLGLAALMLFRRNRRS